MTKEVENNGIIFIFLLFLSLETPLSDGKVAAFKLSMEAKWFCFENQLILSPARHNKRTISAETTPAAVHPFCLLLSPHKDSDKAFFKLSLKINPTRIVFGFTFNYFPCYV